MKNRFKEEMDRIAPSKQKVDETARLILSGGKKPVKRKIKSSYLAAILGLTLTAVFAVTAGLGIYVNDRAAQFSVENNYTASTYQELARVLKGFSRRKATASEFVENSMNKFPFSGCGGILFGCASAPNGGGEDFAPDDAGNGDYSDTNVQVSGVDEADVVKTDGEYIYIAKKNTVKIVSVGTGKMELVYTLKVFNISSNSGNQITEMYRVGDRLIVLVDGEHFVSGESETVRGVGVYICDIADKRSPRVIRNLTQQGEYVSSRMIEDKLYLLTEYYLNFSKIRPNRPETFVPTIKEEGESDILSVEDVYLCGEPQRGNYLVAASVDMEKGEVQSSKGLYGYSADLYCSTTNLYVVSAVNGLSNGRSFNATMINRFSLTDGEIALEASAAVPGRIRNQFSMDEYDGKFRAVTTVDIYYGYFRNARPLPNAVDIPESISPRGRYNALYVLNDDLSLSGQITNIAPEEEVKSARFMGDTAYIVTYRQTDPLFSVDLSDPANPAILGELKIPGFSQYLHPFRDGRLLGFGVSDRSQVKLSMFNTEDKSDVTEQAVSVLYNVYDSPAGENHKAFLCSEAKNVIGFAGNSPSGEKYFIFSYDDEEGFYLQTAVDIDTWNDMERTRGLYIGDRFYVTTGGKVVCLDMAADFMQIQTLFF